MASSISLTSRPAIVGYLIALVAIVAVVGTSTVFNPSEATPGNINVDDQNVAILGFDTVAYFTEGKPTKGSPEFEVKWEDAKWRFASATNRELFEVNPERYSPRYGGYCAGGLAAGEFAPIDPEAWTIVDGKLYLNKTMDLRDSWRKAPAAHIALAETGLVERLCLQSRPPKTQNAPLSALSWSLTLIVALL